MTTTQNVLIGAAIAAVSVAGCTRVEPTASERPTFNVTHWTDRTELYMEYPALVTGRSAVFAVHLTMLGDFKPVATGEVRLEFTPASGGVGTAVVSPKPSRPGAFRVEGTAPVAGRYRWAITLSAPVVNDRHELGEIQVFGDEASAYAQPEPSQDPAAIAYLKEQQWTNEFATLPVREIDMRTSTRAPASVDALPGGEAVVAAPAAGRLVAPRLPSIGDHVRAGDVLGHLQPRLASATDRATLEAEAAEARALLDAARLEHSRAESLLSERAVPARRVEDARRAVIIAEARLKAADARLAQRDATLQSGGSAAGGNAFTLRAPLNGRVTNITATPGASYDEGAPLFQIARTDVVALKAFVPSAEIAAVRNLAGLSLEIPGRPEPLLLRFTRVQDPGVLDPTTKALPIQIVVENRDGQLLIGQSGTAILQTGATQRLPVVPKTAVLTEAGRPYLFVQTGGERFARRYLEIAARDGDLLGIGNGVRLGERVVTHGAYEVQLASAAKGLPAEGHVH